MVDLKIQYLGFGESEAVNTAVQEHIDSLEKMSPNILSCRTILTRPSRKHQQGTTFQVKLLLQLPGTTIVINKDPGLNHAHEDIYVAIRDAFLAARRKVEDYNRIRSGQVKEKVSWAAPGIFLFNCIK